MVASYLAEQGSNVEGITPDAEIVISNLCAAPNIAAAADSVVVASW